MEISISSNTDWQVFSDADWCSVYPTSGKGDTKIHVTYTSNTTANTRTVEINIDGTDAPGRKFILTQERTYPNNPSFSKAVDNPFGIQSTGYSIELIDIDDDGDFDIFTTDEDEPIMFYENIGNEELAVFAEGIEDPFELEAYLSHDLEFVDFDIDGDFDLFTIYPGGIFYIENIGTPRFPDFGGDFLAYPFGIVEAALGLSIADYDNDGDNDIIWIFTGIGLLENIGSVNNPEFAHSVYNPFGFDANGYGVTLIDIDDDGDLDIFTSKDSGVFFCENIGDSTNHEYLSTTQIDPFGISGSGFDIEFADIDADGDYDAFTIDEDVVKFYQNINLTN